MPTPERLSKLQQVAQNRQADITVVLEDVHDPHNAGAVLRSCDAFGIQTVHFVFQKQEPYNPKTVGKNSSSTANKWLDCVIHHSADEALTQLSTMGFKHYMTALDPCAESLFTTNCAKEKIALWFGNEHDGLQPATLDQADTIIYIPMQGIVQSLNISVSAGITIAEATRQKVAQNTIGYLSDHDQNILLEKWLEK